MRRRLRTILYEFNSVLELLLGLVALVRYLQMFKGTPMIALGVFTVGYIECRKYNCFVCKKYTQ